MGRPMIFDVDEDKVPTHDHASDQEEEESIDNTNIPHSDARPTRTTRKYALLNFDFNSQYKQLNEVQKLTKKDVLGQLQEDPHTLEGHYPMLDFTPRSRRQIKDNGIIKGTTRSIHHSICIMR
jgi:hypothetical protein